MDAKSASTENYVDRHNRLFRQLQIGKIVDPELWLFLKLLNDPPAILAATPYLHDVSWYRGQFDLLFTDGLGTWCAVEVKDAPPIRGSGRQRKHRKINSKRRYLKLLAQVETALVVCQRVAVGVVLALGLWHEDGRWVVASQLKSDRGA